MVFVVISPKNSLFICKDKHFASYLYFLTKNISATLRMFNGNKGDYSVKTY